MVGSLRLEHTPLEPTTPNTKGKRLGQRACIERVAQGQRGGGIREYVCWACLKIGRESVLDFDFKRPAAILVDQLPL